MKTQYQRSDTLHTNNRQLPLLLCLLTVFTLLGTPLANAAADTVQTVEWTDLMPPEDLEALLNPPEYLDEIPDGSLEDQISSQLKSALSEDDSRYQQALVSTAVRPEFNNRTIRIPAFIVPLEYNASQQVVQFFLVPYFGACIHVPPPPPNQIIHASYPEGMTLGALYDAFWITGTLKTEVTRNDTATSAYTLQVEKIAPYEE